MCICSLVHVRSLRWQNYLNWLQVVNNLQRWIFYYFLPLWKDFMLLIVFRGFRFSVINEQCEAPLCSACLYIRFASCVFEEIQKLFIREIFFSNSSLCKILLTVIFFYLWRTVTDLRVSLSIATQ